MTNIGFLHSLKNACPDRYFIHGLRLHQTADVSLKPKALSPEVIHNALIHAQRSLLKHKQAGQRYVISSQINPQAKKNLCGDGAKSDDHPLPTVITYRLIA